MGATEGCRLRMLVFALALGLAACAEPEGGRGEGVDAQGRSPEGRSARSLAVVNGPRQLTVSSG